MIVSPSILSSKPETRVQECLALQSFGATWIHLDIMDGIFVPATTFGPEVVEEMKNGCPNLLRDVHLMVVSLDKVIPPFAEAGAEIITFHYEACKDEAEVFANIALIHSYGIKAGISVKPNTPVEVLRPFLGEVDLVLVMSVEPGKGGQAFMDSALDKISFLKEEKLRNAYSYFIEVDGGINDKTAPLCKKAGVEVLVAGSYLFGKDDQKQRMEALL